MADPLSWEFSTEPILTLYQTWKTHTLPPKFQANWDKWDIWCKKHHVNHILMDDKDLRDTVAINYPEFLDFYDHEITENIERVDFWRMVVLASGGVYADLDTYPSETNDPYSFVLKKRIVLGTEPKEHTRTLYLRESILCNAFMISPINDPKSRLFWERAMKFCIENYERHYFPVHNTGPMLLTKFLDVHPAYFKEANVLIEPPCTFYPLIAQQRVSSECDGFKDSYVVHEWSNSWSFKIWSDPVWKNKRHQVYLLSIFFGVMIILAFRSISRKGR